MGNTNVSKPSRVKVVITAFAGIMTFAHVSEAVDQAGRRESSCMPIATTDIRAVLASAMFFRDDCSSSALASLIENSLTSVDPSIRQAALDVVSRRAHLARTSMDSTIPSRLVMDRQALLRIEPAFVSALGDTDDHVRAAAVAAISALLYGSQALDTWNALEPDLLSSIANRYAYEQSAPVRVEVMKMTASSSNRVMGERLAKQGLGDEDSEVLSWAALAAGNFGIESLIDGVCQLLRHREGGVRFAAAQALRQYGSRAARYADDIKTAASREQNTLVRTTLLDVIQRLSPI